MALHKRRSFSTEDRVQYRPARAVIDIGAHKVACAIVAELSTSDKDHSPPEVLGNAVGRAAGIGAGTITDIAAAADSISLVVSRAQKLAGVAVKGVVITASFRGLRSDALPVGSVLTPRAGPVGPTCEAAQKWAETNRRQLISVCIRRSEAAGQKHAAPDLSDLDVVAVSFPSSTAALYAAAVKLCGLEVEEYVAAPVASAFAAFSAVERRGTAIVIDLGGGTTGLAAFDDGIPVFIQSFQGGGLALTGRLAEALGLDLSSAERRKVRYASVFDRANLDAFEFCGGTTGQVSPAAFDHLVKTEVLALIGAVKERLSQAGYCSKGCAAALTGGASQLPGIHEAFSDGLKMPIKRYDFEGLRGLNNDPSLAALAGTCVHVFGHRSQLEIGSPGGLGLTESNYAGRIGRWLRSGLSAPTD